MNGGGWAIFWREASTQKKSATFGGTTRQAKKSLQLLTCFFVSKGTEPKKKSSKRENGQKISAYGHALNSLARYDI